MAQHVRPAPWVVRRFGRETATVLIELLPAALQAAVGRQMDAQQVSRVQTLHPFGGAWPARYEELASHLEDVPGFQVVRPFGRSFDVVLVNNVVILPFEYAKDLKTRLNDRKVLRKLNKMTLELLEQYGPKPSHQQPSIDGLPADLDTASAAEQADLLRGLTPDGIVIVFYAADPRHGILRIGVAEATIAADRQPAWKQIQDLPIPAATPIPGVFALRDDVVTATERQVPRFDEAPLPAPTISARPAGGIATVDLVTIEQPETPRANEHG